MKMPGLLLKSVALLFVCVLTPLLAAEEPKFPKSLDSMRFQSVDKFVIGELPGKSVMGHRTLNFADGMFTYAPSDGIFTGSYKWDEKTGKVEATNIGGGYKFSGEYDPKTKIMTWDKVKYKLIEPAKAK